MIRILYFLMLFSFVAFSSAASYAACTAPVGAEGHMIYNKDYKTAQFCDGTDWWSMKSGGAASGGGGGTDITLQDPYANSTITDVAHGLGAAPLSLTWYLENKTAEYGYSPGQRVYRLASDTSFAINADATNVGVSTSSTPASPIIVRGDGNSMANITVTRWKLGVIVFEN